MSAHSNSSNKLRKDGKAKQKQMEDWPLALSTISTIRAAAGAMQERLNIVPVQFLEGERVKLSRTNGGTDH